MEIPALRDFGLTGNEARAYVALLRYGMQTAADIAPRAGVTRGRVYQILAELSRKGLATELPGRPRSFSPVDPRVALEATLKQRQAEMERAVESLSGWWDRIQRREVSTVPALEVLGRPEQISQHFELLQDQALKEILVFNKAPYVSGEENPAELRALARGLRCRGIYEREFLDSLQRQSHFQTFVEHGEEARVVTELPMKMAIFDRRRALMPLASSHDPSQPFTSVIVHDHGLASSLALTFEHIWDTAELIDDVIESSRSEQQAL